VERLGIEGRREGGNRLAVEGNTAPGIALAYYEILEIAESPAGGGG
jgi:hypothetical protein